MEPESVDALCDRAELYISHQMYEEAVKDYQAAKNVEDHPNKVSMCQSVDSMYLQSMYFCAISMLIIFGVKGRTCTCTYCMEGGI